MKPEKEFDKILQQRIEESEGEFPFDESNWQKASKLIDEERGAAGYYNNKRYLLLGALFLVLGSLGFFTYTYLHSGETVLVAANNQNKSLNEKSNGIPEENSSMVINEKTTEANNNEKYSSNTLSENQSNSQGAEASINAAAGRSTSYSSGSSGIGKTVSQHNLISKRSTGQHNNGKNNSNINSVAQSANKNLSGSEGNHGQYDQAAISPSESEYAGSNMYENLFLSTKISKMPAHNLDADIRKTSYDFIRIYRDDYFTSRKRKTFYLDAEAGTTYLFGWDAPKGKDAKGFNAYAGLNFGFHIRKKFSASVGAQVYNISNIQQPFYTTASVNYDFGSNGTYTTIATNSLLYAAIPVKINYAINKRNIITMGVNTAFLFNGMNTVETFSMADGIKSNTKTIHNSGYYEGTNSLNIMITAGYSRAITRRIKVNGEFMYGLSDTYNTKASNTTKENNMGVRLGLQYTLFDK